MSKRLSYLLVFPVFFCLTLIFSSNVQAATFNVTDGNVYGSGGLVEVMNTAKTNGEVNVINLAEDGTYILTQVNPIDSIYGSNGLPTVINDLTINGNGATITRQSSDYFRFASILSTAIFNVNNLTLSGGELIGFNNGGGFLVDGTVILNAVTMHDNHANNLGGAIYVGGVDIPATLVNVEIYDSVFENNSANQGGAIFNYGDGSDGTLSVYGTRFEDNFATKSGGAIKNNGGPILIDNSEFFNNTNSTQSIDSPTFGGAIASGYLFAEAPTTIIDSTFEGNSAEYGGGIFTERAILTASGNTFTANTATYGAGIFFTTFYARGSVDIQYNEFSSNNAFRGSGVAVRNIFSGTISNNRFASQASGTIYSDFHANGYGDPEDIIQEQPIEAHGNCMEPGGTNFILNGLLNYNSNITVNAENNWWGDASGPAGLGQGSGSFVDGFNINFEPFLTQGCPLDIVNQAPTVDANGPYAVNEGSSIQVSATGNDPENGILTYEWDLDNNGTFETQGQTVTFSATNLDGPDSKTIAVRVTDDGNLAATDTAIVNINNVSPVVNPITGPSTARPVNSSINFSSTFTDVGIPDTHTAIWNWGDNTTSNGSVSESNGSGSVTGAHSYTSAGIYTVTLTISDDDLATAQTTYEVVIYNPNGGWVLGAGIINMPAGSIVANPTRSGNAVITLLANYVNNSLVGATSFTFVQGQFSFRFESTSLDWLVVDGSEAVLHGSGTINGSGNYTFTLTAVNGSPDTYRLQVWNGSTIVFDNGTSNLSIGNILILP